MLAVSALSLLAAASTAPLGPQNFILLMGDDMGWGDVSYNNVSSRIHQPGAGGEPFLVNPPRTPHLDEMARSENSIQFNRFYAGSAVCSPTRASALTGRTSDRDCVSGAEGCGQQPAWSCTDHLPLSPRTFTIAEAAKTKGYATLHIGKWHLGNFFPKPGKNNWVNAKWPVSSPRTHGFDEWHSTEASASSSMCNCGCNPAWASSPGGDPVDPSCPAPVTGVGCITGGGNFSATTYDCTNYWSPTDLDAKHQPTNTVCASAANATLGGCVGNMTKKIMGDDTREIMDMFEEFLGRKGPGKSEAAPFVAVLWLHTNHMPHPAMPEWYHAYNDANGQPAGDYLGTLSQMDNQIGRLRKMLKTYGVAQNTAVWFTADNGPHTQSGGGCTGQYARSSNQATNGLRQCKASLYEGGIREPGILEWPAMITSHRETEFPAYVSDYLPTFLEFNGIAHPHPTWNVDGISLLPLIRQAAALPTETVTVQMNRTKPLGFQLGGQTAWIDNEYKLISGGSMGQCSKMLPPYKSGKGVYLFNLVTDPTESHDLSESMPDKFQAMSAAMKAWSASIKVSQVEEAQCEQSGPSPGPGPGPAPAPEPVPPTPPTGGFTLTTASGAFLTLSGIMQHAPMVLGQHADGGSKWQTASGKRPALYNMAPGLGSNSYAKVDGEKGTSPCTVGNQVWTGKHNKNDGNVLELKAVGSKYQLVLEECAKTPLCASGSPMTLAPCAKATFFTKAGE